MAAITDHVTPISGFGVSPVNSSSVDPNQTARKSNGPGDLVYYGIWTYAAPILIAFGLVGNALVFLVVRRRSLRGTTTSLYLQLVAVADNCCILFSLFPDMLEEMDAVVIKNLHPATCKIQKFLQYVSLDIAVWLLAAFAFDRFVAVCFPFRKEHICRPKKAKVIASLLLMVAVIKNVHVFFTRGREYAFDKEKNTTYVKKTCGNPTEEYAYFSYYIRPWVVFVLSSVLPLVFILVCNLWIVAELTRHRPERISSSSHKDKTHRQMTAMCLSVSFLFIVCTIPSIIMYIGRPWWMEQSPQAYKAAKGIINLLMYINHSVNFVMYSVTGKKFREELQALVCCRPDTLTSYRPPTSQQYDSKIMNNHSRLTEVDENSDQSENMPLTDKHGYLCPGR